MYSRSAAIFTYETALSTLRGNATPPILNSAVQVKSTEFFALSKNKIWIRAKFRGTSSACRVESPFAKQPSNAGCYFCYHFALCFY